LKKVFSREREMVKQIRIILINFLREVINKIINNFRIKTKKVEIIITIKIIIVVEVEEKIIITITII
jgi:hypothetical protein